MTAWVGLFKYGGLKAGNYVLLGGTGGVSTFGLIFAAAAGAKQVLEVGGASTFAKALEALAFDVSR